jgi:hypothetical protein
MLLLKFSQGAGEIKTGLCINRKVVKFYIGDLLLTRDQYEGAN